MLSLARSNNIYGSLMYDNCGEWDHKHCVANERSILTDGNFLCFNC